MNNLRGERWQEQQHTISGCLCQAAVHPGKLLIKSRLFLSLCLLMALSCLSPLKVIGPPCNLKEGAEMRNSPVITRIKECKDLVRVVQRQVHE